MRNRLTTVLVVAALLATTWLGVALHPHEVPSAHAAIDLAALVPDRFGNWELAPEQPVVSIPALKRKVEATYQQSLERIFVGADGRRIMLSLAYGSNQLGDGMQVHRPEYCYPAQGFEVGTAGDDSVMIGKHPLPVRQLIARRADRNEPITYWITIGEKALLPGLARKMTQLRYGLRGQVPDGMLIRVSSIDDNANRAFGDQKAFIQSWLTSIGPSQLRRLSGVDS
jgi:EpsI family protein